MLRPPRFVLQDGDMGEIVNLRRVKKARRRAEAADAAQQNRVRHGRTAAQKANDDRERDRAAKAAACARLDDRPD
jgi:hypothetical protein